MDIVIIVNLSFSFIGKFYFFNFSHKFKVLCHFAYKISEELCNLLNIRRFRVKPKDVAPKEENKLLEVKNTSSDTGVNTPDTAEPEVLI